MNKTTILQVDSDGVPIGSEADHASRYLKQVLSFIGLSDVTIIDAAKFDVKADNLALLEIASHV